MTRGLVVALTIAFAACSSARDASPPGESAPLPEGVAARVGNEDVSVELVRRIAGAQGVSLPEARRRAISDALFAAHAKQAMAGSGSIETAERSALARAMLERLKREAENRGPPSDAEVEAITNERWLDLARPPLVRTTHAVVQFSSPADAPKAKRAAEAIASAVAGIKDSTEFDKRARAVPSEGLKVDVEHLLPVAPDGRSGDPKAPRGMPAPPPLEKAYATAAHAIPEVGAQSPIIQTSYGYHVILLEERLPEIAYSFEERRALVTPEVMSRRATDLENALLEPNKPAVRYDRAIVELLSRVQVSR